MPKPLHFRQQSVDPILNGAQKVTVRRAGSGYRRGDVVKAVRRNQPAFAELHIERVQNVGLDDLTSRHARHEGQPDLDSLRASMKRLFPGEEEFEVITFRLV
ncbi:MAG TPA: ASCH domain-containing protein [Candidatus Dormibacteraeota bacterium]